MLKNNRGIALLITLTAIVVLVAVGFELNRQIQSSAAKAGIGRDMGTLQQMLTSGVSIAESILVKDKNETEADSVQEDWADPEIVEQYVSAAGFEEDSLSVEITDELGRIQANALVDFPEGKEFNPAQRELWERFFNLILHEFENSEEAGDSLAENLEPDMIINPVKDWLDSGDDDSISGLSGAEQDYYMNLDSPYSCRNGAFRDVSEMVRVKNIDPVMFSKIGENPGLSDFITVNGMEPSRKDKHEAAYPGRININTAPVAVLAALLPRGHEFLAEEIAAYREASADGEYVNDLQDSGWYKNVAGLGDVDIKDELITTKSDLFRIRCEAEKNGNRLAATVLVRRQQEEETGKWKCRVLKWQYEPDA
ncbi:MAG: general secretion pathway protein GspK [Desulfobacterales bacterium]